MNNDSWLRYLEVRIPDFFRFLQENYAVDHWGNQGNQPAKELTIGHLGLLDEQQWHMILENARKITLW
jgi:hypothetical protein